MKPGEVPHGTTKEVTPRTEITVERAYDARPTYEVYWCPAFPIDRLGYGSNRPLWRESLSHEYPWRSALYEDFRARGQINPVLVWDHTNPGYPGPDRWENYVKVGRNKCWVARQLEWTTVKALVCRDVAAGPPPGAGEATKVTPETILDHWVDGHIKFLQRGLLSQGCTDPAKLEFPRGVK